MTEEIAGTPGWVDARLDEVFAGLPGDTAVGAARAAYADCLATQKDPVAPSADLGAGYDGCRSRLRGALADAGVTGAAWAKLDAELEALEAEITADS